MIAFKSFKGLQLDRVLQIGIFSMSRVCLQYLEKGEEAENDNHQSYLAEQLDTRILNCGHKFQTNTAQVSAASARMLLLCWLLMPAEISWQYPHILLF